MQTAEFNFGRYSFDPRLGVLSCDDIPVPLGRRATRLLGALLSNRGAVVSKAELMDAAWPRTAVEESNLSVQIAYLRRRLGRAPFGGEWITAVSGVGYRFAPDVPDARRSLPAQRIGPPSLAVLPFHDFDGPSSDGMVEDLTTALAQFKSIRVTARRSSLVYRDQVQDVRQIAAELGVRYMLEGSTRQSSGRLLTTARLIDGISGAHLWAQTFDRPIGSGHDEKVSITARIAATAEAQIHATEIAEARRRVPESREAYASYLQGRFRLQSSRQFDNALAYSHFLRALELEPDNAEFLAGAAEAMHHRVCVGWDRLTGNDRKGAVEHMRRGLDNVGDDAVSLSLFACAMLTGGEEDEALAIATLAAGLNPNSPLILVTAALANYCVGDIDEAFLHYERAAQLNPTDPAQRFALSGLAAVSNAREDFAQARLWAKRAHVIGNGLSRSNWHLIAACAHLGRMDEARRYLEFYRSISPEVTISRIKAGQPVGDNRRLGPMIAGLRLAGLPEN